MVHLRAVQMPFFAILSPAADVRYRKDPALWTVVRDEGRVCRGIPRGQVDAEAALRQEQDQDPQAGQGPKSGDKTYVAVLKRMCCSVELQILVVDDEHGHANAALLSEVMTAPLDI